MNEIIQIFFGSLVVAFSGALVPGPMFTLVVTSAARKGFRTSLFIVIGHAILELAVVISFYLGVLKYLNKPTILNIISLLGGIFLLFMGINILISIFRKKIKLDLDPDIQKGSLSRKSSIATAGNGILISLANPYWYIWWLSIGAAFMLKSVKFNITGISTFYIGHISADFIWYLFIGFIVSTGRRFLSQKVYVWVLIACSLFLFYLGIKFILDFFI
ncbi:MAG: LysE family translocator [Actinobacteria bacterium]|nr:LysE family translocator [Actinomycetota bacterium]